MFPLSDITPRKSFPYMNYLIIFLNIIFFIIMLFSNNIDYFLQQYGFIPDKFNFLSLLSYKNILHLYFYMEDGSI